MWHYLFENHFLIRLRRRFPVTLIYTTWLSSRRPAHVVNFYTLLACSLFRRQFGYAPFRLLIKFSTIHVYARTCACPEKAALMYFSLISLEHVLGMIDFPQIVQTMNRQVICAELSASSRFYVYRNNAV